MLKLKPQYFGHLMRRTESFEKTLMLGKIEGRRRRGRERMRRLDGSLTQWTWVWVNSRSLWWTGRPGMLQSMGSQSQTQLSHWTELNHETPHFFKNLPKSFKTELCVYKIVIAQWLRMSLSNICFPSTYHREVRFCAGSRLSLKVKYHFWFLIYGVSKQNKSWSHHKSWINWGAWTCSSKIQIYHFSHLSDLFRFIWPRTHCTPKLPSLEYPHPPPLNCLHIA